MNDTALTSTQQRVLDTMEKIIPHLDDGDLMYLLGFGESRVEMINKSTDTPEDNPEENNTRGC